MARFFALALVSVAFSLQAQNPLYNPDFNGDGYIGVDDLLALLSNFSAEWVTDSGNAVYGCTYPFYQEYDPLANTDDGSCATLLVMGCTDVQACNYDPAASIDNGTCDADADGDGLCDSVDACIGTLDACGVCNGPGAVYECGCADVPDCNCDCEGNVFDAIGECGGTCEFDVDGDGKCDDEDECVGTVDECGVCNGVGAAFQCGCDNIPAGDCDCNGTQVDALGVCGGTCAADADGDGICDEMDDCVGEFDACGVCNGPGEIYACGCLDIPEGNCDCDGNELDAIGVCGGTCTMDENADGICDLEVGCPDPFACNYDPSANPDNACVYVANPAVEFQEFAWDYSLEMPCGGDGMTMTGMYVVSGNTILDTNEEYLVFNWTLCDETLTMWIPEQMSFSFHWNGESFVATASENQGSCATLTPAVFGCTESTAPNYNPSATVDDGSCPGCTYPLACNFNANAGQDDGSCEFQSCYGCTDPEACNFEATATQDDGGCMYIDTDEDGVCDENEVIGCMDMQACNFDPTASEEEFSNWSQVGADIDGEFGGGLSGNSVSISSNGSTVAVGAPHTGTFNGYGSGQVRIYDLDGGGWVQRGASLDGEYPGVQFGKSVSLSSDGSVVAIGAYRHDGSVGSQFGDRGQTRVFSWNGSSWNQLGELIDGESESDESGISVSLSANGTRLAIGAPKNDGGGTDINYNSGHVRVFAWDGVSWIQQGADIDGESADDFSGYSVSLSEDGTRVAIGAPGNEYGTEISGSVRVFAWTGLGGWVQLGADISGAALGDEFGKSVSLSSDGTAVAIGSPGNDENGADSGRVRIFAWDGVNWIEQGTGIWGEAAGDQCGYSVSLASDGTTVATGAIGNDGNGDASGHVRVFVHASSQFWIPQGSEVVGEASGDKCGSSVALSSNGTTVAIGAQNNVGSGSWAGHVRVFAFEGASCEYHNNLYDCDGNCLNDEDANGICDDLEGCTFPFACNYNMNATVDNGSCEYAEQYHDCDNNCLYDTDSDGVCDDVDDCVGAPDSCGVCNGPGAIYDCGCADIPQGDCDCNGNQLDALGVCGGACVADADGDGICDDVDACVGSYDACGVCNGVGPAFQCGCGNIPEGDCDCNGNQLDALGVCGGACAADEDGDGICDDLDDCVGAYDACGVCNGDNSSCTGCTDSTACNYDGATIDDGSCVAPDFLTGCGDTCLDGGVLYTFEITDSFGDGMCCNWGNGSYTILVNGYVLITGGNFGASAFERFCAPANACIQLVMVSDGFPGEQTWSFAADGIELAGAGLDGSSATYNFGGCWSSCGDPLTYQGYDYATVLIGGQCWFAENLRSENYLNGDVIPSNLSENYWNFTTSGASTVYGGGYGCLSSCSGFSPDGDVCNETWSLNEYGRLYNWLAVVDSRGLCPSGWHVPTDGEWMTMEMALGMSEADANGQGWRGTDQGTQMKTDYGWAYGGNGTNSSGFSGLPGGFRESWAYFEWGGEYGGWWSSSPIYADAWCRGVQHANGQIRRYVISHHAGLSVRCLRDAE